MTTRAQVILISCWLAACGGAAVSTPPPRATAPTGEPRESGPPRAEVRPVTTTYHGVEVVDPYQWLERPDDPEVRAWSDAQNALQLDRLEPLLRRLVAIDAIVKRADNVVPGVAGG